jgi:hypothetical protein
VEPENGFDQHVHHRRQVVATADVRHLVSQDRHHLLLVETVTDCPRPHQNRTEQAEDARLQHGRGLDQPDRSADAGAALEPSKRVEFPTAFHHGRGACNCRDSAPASPPEPQNAD